mmetsp:Transcript_35845/g.47315  ORF Transcript_35845/g.47315 Transcript_35845/m.47315 type:complete len:380 (+) Transcript_35845:173-1312(+)
MGNCFLGLGNNPNLNQNQLFVLQGLFHPNTNWDPPSSKRAITTLDIRHHFVITRKELGHGSFGVVRECISRRTGGTFAVKSVCKVRVDDIKILQREVAALKHLSHVNIIKLEADFEDQYFVHLVTPIYSGPQLFTYVNERRGAISEDVTADLLFQIVDAVAYCHSRGIVHRDIKLENFVFETAHSDAKLKLLDFGLSRSFNPSKRSYMKTIVGTREYLSPEVIKGKYTEKCDFWAIGIIAYVLLGGAFPFLGKCEGETMYKILEKDVRFPFKDWRRISSNAKDLVSKLLLKDWKSRPAAKDIILHPFFGSQNVSEIEYLSHKQSVSGELSHIATQASLCDESFHQPKPQSQPCELAPAPCELLSQDCEIFSCNLMTGCM